MIPILFNAGGTFPREHDHLVTDAFEGYRTLPGYQISAMLPKSPENLTDEEIQVYIDKLERHIDKYVPSGFKGDIYWDYEPKGANDQVSLWGLQSGRGDPERWSKLLNAVLGRIKGFRPGARCSMYSFPLMRSIGEYPEKWSTTNDTLREAGFFDAFDFLCPSFYAKYRLGSVRDPGNGYYIGMDLMERVETGFAELNRLIEWGDPGPKYILPLQWYRHNSSSRWWMQFLPETDMYLYMLLFQMFCGRAGLWEGVNMEWYARKTGEYITTSMLPRCGGLFEEITVTDPDADADPLEDDAEELRIPGVI